MKKQQVVFENDDNIFFLYNRLDNKRIIIIIIITIIIMIIITRITSTILPFPALPSLFLHPPCPTQPLHRPVPPCLCFCSCLATHCSCPSLQFQRPALFSSELISLYLIMFGMVLKVALTSTILLPHLLSPLLLLPSFFFSEYYY